MTAVGRITTTRIESGTRLVVERGPGGRLLPTNRKRGSITVTVTGKDVVTVEGGRQRCYVIHTADGQTLPVRGAQTFMLATDPEDTAPAVPADVDRAEMAARLDGVSRHALTAPTCSDPVGHVPGVLGCTSDVTNCNGVPDGLEMTGRLIAGDMSPAATGVEEVARAIVSALAVRHAVASARFCSADPYGRGGVRVGSTVSALVDEHRVIVALYYGRPGPLSEESTFYAVLVDGAVIAGALPGARTPHDVGTLVARAFRCWLMDRPAVTAPAVITIAVGTCPKCGTGTGAPTGYDVVTCAHCDASVPMHDEERLSAAYPYPTVTVADAADVVQGPGRFTTTDTCTECGEDIDNPHADGCSLDSDPTPAPALADWAGIFAEINAGTDDTDDTDDQDGAGGTRPDVDPIDQGPTGGAVAGDQGDTVPAGQDTEADTTTTEDTMPDPTSYRAGHAAAAEREAEHAVYAANLSDQNAEAARVVADRNPAAEECATIAGAAAVSAANNLVARTAEAEAARTAEVAAAAPVAGDQDDTTTGRPSMSKTYAVDQSKIDAPDFPRDLAWWQRFTAEWMGPEMLPDGTVLLTASGSAAQATALGKWIEGCAGGRLAGAYRRLTRQEVQELRRPVAGDQDDAQPGDDTAAEPIYTAAIEAYAPTLKSDDDAELTITHDHENGTVMDGGCKGDGTLEIVAVYRFQWRRYAGVHIPGSRDKFADLVSIDKAAEALRAAGHTVAVDIDDVWRPAGVREEHRAERVTARVERLAARATRKFAESDARHLAARNISDRMPFGEPIKVGHHSERAHRRAFDRIDNNTRASIATGDYARHLADRAAGAESNEDAKNGPRAIMRRIETLETEARSWARELADERTGDGRRRRATLEAEKIAEDVRHQRAKLGDMAASGAFVAWAGEHFTAGDWANVGGRWCEVARVNKKGVSVRGRFDWQTSVGTVGAVKWDEIHGRRRDGMQWDAPNAEPYSVQEAQQAAKWRTLVRDAARSESRSNEPTGSIYRRLNVEEAERITLGLAPDACAAEVAAYGTPDTKDARRVRALACLAVFERLEAGEKAADVAATVDPIGDTVPTWTMPAGDTVDVYPRELVAGDVVAGMYDRMWGGGNTLLRSFAGPLAAPPVHEDRHESGDWYTVRLTTGDVREMKSHQVLAVHRVTVLDDEPASPVADADQHPTYGLDVDGVRVATVTHVDLTVPAETAAEVPADVQAGDRVDVGWSGGLVDVSSVEGGRLVGEFGVPDETVRVPLEQVRAVVRDGVTGYPVRDVTVVNDAHGNLEAHRPGCRDIAATLSDAVPSGGGSWDVSTRDVRGLIVEAYAEHEGFAADASNWRNFAGDLTVMPCLPGFPDEAPSAVVAAGPAAEVPAVEPVTLAEWADVAALIGDQLAVF